MEAARLHARGELEDAADEEAKDQHDAQHLQEQFAHWGIVDDGDDAGAAVGGARYFYLWPQNVPAWNLFMACSTQWRHGFSGPTGLDYPCVEVVLRREGVRPSEQSRMWRLLCAMERGALQGWAELRDERRKD